jgi:hypothetical protein
MLTFRSQTINDRSSPIAVIKALSPIFANYSLLEYPLTYGQGRAFALA